MSEEFLEPVRVMCVTAAGGLQGIGTAWQQLESRLPSLKGRKFYGVFQYPDGPYRACVAVRTSDEPQRMQLETLTIPGGKYARRKLPNWEENKDRIPEIFGEMAEQHSVDGTRPSIEFYRSQKELLLYLPIL